MKKTNYFTIQTIRRYAFLLGFSILLIACNDSPNKAKNDTTDEEVSKAKDIIWNIKAIHPEGKTFDVKAIDEEGNLFDISAIQNSDQDSFLDIKAFVGEKKLPVKMLVSDDKYAPVKAIDKGGIAFDIKAITDEGEKLDVKGIVRHGNIVSLKAINKEGEFYGVKAISPTGKLNDVKGIKINIKEKEMTLNGFNVFAHIKAMHQCVYDEKSREEDEKTLWNLNAITLEGKNLEIKAIGPEGNQFDVKAIQDSDQHSFMDIKAFVNESVYPVKVLVSKDEYLPVKAIARDGTIFDIKAITPDGTILDVKGVSRSGTIINIKAISENGDFYGVKAFSPDGKLNDVKGIKIFKRDKELSIRGNEVHAHVKAITQ